MYTMLSVFLCVWTYYSYFKLFILLCACTTRSRVERPPQYSIVSLQTYADLNKKEYVRYIAIIFG